MQDNQSVPPLDSRPTQSRDDKIAVLRRNGYAPDRCAALEGETAPPAVPDDLTEEPTQVAPEDTIQGFDGPGTYLGILLKDQP